MLLYKLYSNSAAFLGFVMNIGSRGRLGLPFIVAAAIFLLSGCGGGVSGTGGISGDLDGNQKIAELNQSDRQELCGRIITAATDSQRDARFLISYQVAYAIFNRYRYESKFETGAHGETNEIVGELKPSFAAATPDSINQECQAEYNRVDEYQQHNAQCFDANTSLAGEGYNGTPEQKKEFGIFGACDLEDPSLKERGTSVGELASCLEEYYQVQSDGAVFNLDCNSLYQAISDGRKEEIVVTASDADFERRAAATEAFQNRCASVLNGATAQSSIVPVACTTMSLDDPFVDQSLKPINSLVFFE